MVSVLAFGVKMLPRSHLSPGCTMVKIVVRYYIFIYTQISPLSKLWKQKSASFMWQFSNAKLLKLRLTLKISSLLLDRQLTGDSFLLCPHWWTQSPGCLNPEALCQTLGVLGYADDHWCSLILSGQNGRRARCSGLLLPGLDIAVQVAG
jgi:hypothetical protein